jgi:hypothetical protein
VAFSVVNPMSVLMAGMATLEMVWFKIVAETPSETAPKAIQRREEFTGLPSIDSSVGAVTNRSKSCSS